MSKGVNGAPDRAARGRKRLDLRKQSLKSAFQGSAVRQRESCQRSSCLVHLNVELSEALAQECPPFFIDLAAVTFEMRQS